MTSYEQEMMIRAKMRTSNMTYEEVLKFLDEGGELDPTDIYDELAEMRME